MEGLTGLFATVILALGIGYLTVRGFCREAVNLKNSTCCGSGSCSCAGNCSGKPSCAEDRYH